MENSQREAIKKTRGPCVILAGAGTGKTYTIVEKIKYLIENKVYFSDRIVCITFSNEAANNVLSRIRKSLPSLEEEPIIKTFHSFSADLLRKYGEKININKRFKILDPDQAKITLHKNFKLSPYLCHKYIAAISTAKDLGITIENLASFLNKRLSQFESIDLEKTLESIHFELQTLYLKKGSREKSILSNKARKIKQIIDLKKFLNSWRAYEKVKALNNFQDYSDLNNNALLLLQKNHEIPTNFDYIIVDEFQDTNKVQLDFLLELASHGNITIVGDLNQSIYRFRGAYKGNFLEFKNHFKIDESNIFNLNSSFRSTDKILKSSHNLILNNYQNREECFEVKNFQGKEGENIKVFELKNEKEEARKIIELIKESHNDGVPLEEICVMFRTHQQGQLIKKILESNKIPFYSVTKTSLLKQNSIKIIIDYLIILDKLKRNSNGGEQAWWDLIYRSNFSEKDLIEISGLIKESKDTNNSTEAIMNKLKTLSLTEEGKIASQLLLNRLNEFLDLVDAEIPKLIVTIFHNLGFLNENKTKEEKEKLLNLKKFSDLAKNYSELYSSNLYEFLHYLEILKNLDIDIEAADIEQRGVRLMTLHATKGLEYNTVIMTNLVQNRFPIIKSNSNSLIPLELYPEINHKVGELSEDDKDYFIYEYEKANQLFEERRLCYVAFTRAKEHLILTYANEYSNKKFYPSQFLHEISYKDNPHIDFLLDNDEKYSSFQVSIPQDVRETTLENLQDINFSPSALLLFSECQKKYEYKYKYNMPEEKAVNFQEILLGSFVHQVLEKGVNCKFKTAKQFIDLAKELYVRTEWETIDFNEAEFLIKIFFERNKHKISAESKTEQMLKINLSGMRFLGFADRIDFAPEGIEIVDYKTGKSVIPTKNRNWQLGYYAIAASRIGKVRRMTLDMLRHEKPFEFEISDSGIAYALNSDRIEFNIKDVERELVETAKQVLEAYRSGFKLCPLEKNCEFCNEYFYSKNS